MSSLKRMVVVGLAIATLGAAGPVAARGVYDGDSDLRLMLNIPASRLDVFERGKLTRTYDVSAGRREFSTPAGKYRITRVTWNPWWHPPDSKWAREEKPTPPGPNNPMGRVKINFAPLLYIHGTPYEDDLGAPASHGCIRISDRDLLELTHLIHRYRTPRVDKRLLETLARNHSMTRTFHVRPVPFDVVYNLVEIRDDNLIIHPDVYRTAGEDLHKEVVAALKKKGVKVTPGVEDRVSAISKTRNATRLTVSLDSLVAGGPAGE